jgi:hypothetical protein
MVMPLLSTEMIASGELLIRELDRRGLAPDAAFWLFVPERQDWTLVLGEQKVSSKGPRWLYQQIREAISDDPGPMALDNITAVSNDDPLVKLLGHTISTGPGISGIRFTNNVINGTVIEDAYIYRLMSR